MSNILRQQREIIFMQGRCSRDICNTVRYMKYNYGFEHIKSVRMNGKHRAIMTMKDDYYDDDIREILKIMSDVFECSVLAEWGI